MTNDDVLNDLIEINNDRVDGYNKAARQANDEDLYTLFMRMANQSKQYATDLRELLVNKKKDPENGTTVRGKVYRVWMDVKKAFTGGDRKAILSSCEFGEDAAQRAYKAALEEDDLQPATRTVIETQKAALLEAHDRIKDLRDSQPA
jgi:uncharacterized protein (TIGR02284 family)